jgi:hypothetical protein
MVDEGGSVPPIINSINELLKKPSSSSSSIPINTEQNGGKVADNAVQISPFGKGLGKQPLDFELIYLIPGAGLNFFLFLFIF